MKLEVFTLFDAATKLYGHPFYSVSAGDACRSFQAACADPNSKLSKFPKDFALFHIATYDDASAQFDPVIPPRHLMSAHECVRSVSEVNQ